MKREVIYTAILASILSGCNSETSSQSVESEFYIQPVGNIPEPTDNFIDPIDVGEPVDKFINPICLEGDCVVGEIPEPIPQQPIFTGINVTPNTQQPLTGIVGNCNAWIKTPSPIEFIHELSIVEVDVKYRYEPYVEFYMTDHSGNEVCARYSVITQSFGSVQPTCLWSDVRDDIKLEDFKQSYYGYGVSKVGVFVNGVSGEELSVRGWVVW